MKLEKERLGFNFNIVKSTLKSMRIDFTYEKIIIITLESFINEPSNLILFREKIPRHHVN